VTGPHVAHTWPLGWTVGSIGGDALRGGVGSRRPCGRLAGGQRRRWGARGFGELCAANGEQSRVDGRSFSVRSRERMIRISRIAPALHTVLLSPAAVQGRRWACRALVQFVSCCQAVVPLCHLPLPILKSFSYN